MKMSRFFLQIKLLDAEGHIFIGTLATIDTEIGFILLTMFGETDAAGCLVDKMMLVSQCLDLD